MGPPLSSPPSPRTHAHTHTNILFVLGQEGEKKSAYTLNSSAPPWTFVFSFLFLRVNSCGQHQRSRSPVYPCARLQILISLSYSTASIFTTPPHIHHAKCKCRCLAHPNERRVHFCIYVRLLAVHPKKVHIDFMLMSFFSDHV